MSKKKIRVIALLFIIILCIFLLFRNFAIEDDQTKKQYNDYRDHMTEDQIEDFKKEMDGKSF